MRHAPLQRRATPCTIAPTLVQRNRSVAEINHEMARRLRTWLFAQHYSRSTYDFYYSVSRKFCLYLGSRPLRDVHPVDIADFLASSISPMASDTVTGNWLGALRVNKRHQTPLDPTNLSIVLLNSRAVCVLMASTRSGV